MKLRRLLIIINLLLLITWTIFLFYTLLNTSFNTNKSINSYQSFFSNVHTRRNQLIQKQNGNTSGESEEELITNFLQDTNSGTTQLVSSDRISLNDIVSSIHNYDMTGSLIPTSELEQQYRSSKDPQQGIEYITRLTKEFNYPKAYKELQQIDSITIKSMNPHLVLRIFFNSELVAQKTQNLTMIENVIGEFLSAKLISTEEAQRYKSLILLIKGDKTNFLLNLPKFNTNSKSEIKDLVEDIRNKAKQTTQGHDIPSYYTDGIISLSLFQYGYPYLAQQLSLNILSQYPNYILPKQILAYSHMILHERSQAQSYFLQLITTDSKNIHNYQFFAGVCAYRLEKHTDAILYLNQIPSDKVVSDAIRYKILSYIALQDYTNTTKQIKYLLGQTDVSNSDMMLVWEQTVFIPYITGKPYDILSKDNTILDLYTERCMNQQFDQIICQIGKLAKDVYISTNSYSDSYLKSIIERFPRSYIYYLLGEYYLKQGNKTDAQKSFITALSLSTDTEVRKKITNKIKGIL